MCDALGAMPTIVMKKSFRAPIERVWARIDDHAGMRDWLGAPVKVRGDGGIGTVRTIGSLVTFDETVVEREAPRRMVYRITRGVPVTHRGEVQLTERMAGGTDLLWTISIDSRIPLFARGILLVLEPTILRGLGRLASLLDAG